MLGGCIISCIEGTTSYTLTHETAHCFTSLHIYLHGDLSRRAVCLRFSIYPQDLDDSSPSSPFQH